MGIVNGQWGYVLNGDSVQQANYQALALGQTATDAFNITLADSNGGSASEPVNISVVGVGAGAGIDPHRRQHGASSYRRDGRRHLHRCHGFRHVVDARRHRHRAELLVDQGVRPDIAERLLTDVGIAHQIDLKLAYFGYLRQQMGRRMENPPGFLVDLLRSKAPVPANFQARMAEVQRAALPPSPEDEAAVERAMRDMELRNLYGDMCDEKVREYSDAHPGEAAKLRNLAAKRVRKQKPELIAQGEGHFYREVQRDVEVQILRLARVPAFDEWSQAMRQSSLF